MRSRNIIISTTDRDRLLRLLDSARMDWQVNFASIVALDKELARARCVDPSRLPVDVVSMGSTVWTRDLDTQEVEQYTLTVPADADVLQDRISVLAPIGTALLGYRVGDTIEWQVPSGRRRFEIVKVAQPRAQHYAEEQNAVAEV